MPKRGTHTSQESRSSAVAASADSSRSAGACLVPPTYGIEHADRPQPLTSRVQTKLKIGSGGDRYEREADQVADHVMRMPLASTGIEPPPIDHRIQRMSLVQRLAAHRSPSLADIAIVEDDGARSPTVQALRAPGQAQQVGDPQKQGQSSGMNEISSHLLKSSRGGRPMGAETKQFMESRFGQDFSPVKIHTDDRAANLSRSLGARAFAHGSNLYFGKGEYRPNTHEGKRVLAHELTHVVQQGATGNQPAVANQPATAHQTPAIQRLGPLPATADRDDVAPWGPNGPTGSNYTVDTDSGNSVTAWKAYSPWQVPLQYWCHGHTLDSYANHQYSVYSGRSLQQVIRDEWKSIPAGQATAGDIAVWTAGWDHSAKFAAPSFSSGGSLDPATTMMTSKNGQNPLARMTLSAVIGVYGATGVAVFRRK